MSRTAAFFAILVFLLCTACTRQLQTPTIDLDGQYAALSQQKVQEAIVQACAYEGWTIREKTDSSVHAALNWKNKHFVDVSIHHDTQGITIGYVASRNMSYSADKTPKIHHQYNAWVQSLADCIRGYLDLEVSQIK